VCYVFEGRGVHIFCVLFCFVVFVIVCMLFSKKQAVWRKEKEMKNKVMNILKYFVFVVVVVDTKNAFGSFRVSGLNLVF